MLLGFCAKHSKNYFWVKIHFSLYRAEVEEDGLFEIKTTTLVFSTKDKESVEVKVKAKDTGVSGVSKEYTLCLTVLPSERNETRANVSNRCIVVKVINENSK